MDLLTENLIWRSRTQKKTRALRCNEERFHHSRRSALTNDTTENMARHYGLVQKRYCKEIGATVWDDGESASAPAETRRKAIKKQRRGKQTNLKALDEEIDRAWEGVIKGTGTQQIACLRQLEDAYEKQDEMRSTLRSTAAMDPDSASKQQKAGSASYQSTQLGRAVSQTARLALYSRATKHQIIHHNDKSRRRDVSKLDVTRLLPNSMSNRPMRVRASQSDNNYLLKRTRHRENFVHKRRTLSEPILRKNRFGHHENVAGGAEKAGRLQQLNSSALPTQKQLLSTNGIARTQSAHARKRRTSTVQDEYSSVKKSLRSRFHSQGTRSSERLLQLRKRATRSQSSDKSLHNHGIKRTKGFNESEQIGKNPSMRLRSSVRQTTSSKKQGLPNGFETASRSKSARATVKKTVADEAKEKPTIQIPADTNMATSLRGYSQWPDDSGALASTQGSLLPAKYNFSGIPGFDWICPVRSCRRCFQSQSKLGFHFIVSHHSCLLNDNCDGTFTVDGHYNNYQNGKHRPALVKSKIPLPRNAPPMLEPRPPASWVKVAQQQRFVESLKKASSLTGPDSGEVYTIDEMMLHSGFLGLSSTGGSDASELSSLSRTPSFEDSKQRSSKRTASSPNGSDLPDDPDSNKNTARRRGTNKNMRKKVSHPPSDPRQDNWRLIRKFLTGRQFYPPKRGHFAALLSTPRIRDILTRPGVRFVADQPKKIRLLIVHMTGKEPPVPCNSCALGRGPFKKCVAISNAAAGETTNGIVCCTNCANKRGLQHNCNLENLLDQPAPVQQREQRKGHLAPQSREQSSLSNANSRVTKVDSRFTFAVHVLPVDSSLDLDPEPLSIRLCSVAAGKVMVELEGSMPFLIGPHGMFKLMPETIAQVSNSSEEEAVLHVSTLKS